jgi:toxin ParE1/3/4
VKAYRVRFTSAAVDDLIAIFDYVAKRAGARIAEGFVSRLETACGSLDAAPYRGTARDDLRPGLRTFGVERRATILFTVNEARSEAVILGVFYGGRDIDELAVGRD